MNKLFKKFLLIILTLFTMLAATSCDLLGYTVSFEVGENSSYEKSTKIGRNDVFEKPADPEKEGYEFVYWYTDDENIEYSFEEPITGSFTLYAYWINSEEKALEDYEAIKAEGIILNDYELRLRTKGPVNGTTIVWDTKSKYVSKGGFVLPSLNDNDTNITLTATFKRGDYEITKDFSVPHNRTSEVVITEEKIVDFENLTTEYEVDDGSLSLYFEENGSIPYVDILDFLTLVVGFVDPEVEFSINKTATKLEISYDYYDEDEDHTYNLVNTVDLLNNTITANDPGFYMAYVYTTKTNYGRHIEYLYDHELNYYEEGNDVVYELSNYNLSLTSYEEKILAPLYLVNQLYAGSSYYNVYYNHDGLYGIYALPSEKDDEYKVIKSSSKNLEELPIDLLVHTINTLAFNMDYFYGLKDILEIETFYNYIFDQKDRLFTTNARNFDTAIFDLLVKDIDEPHTSYGYPSYYNAANWAGPKISSLDQFGTRMKEFYNDGLYAVDDVIESKWGREGITKNQWAADSKSRPEYWFLDDSHAVLSFDNFVTSDIEESNKFESDIVKEILKVDDIVKLVPEISGGSKYFYYNTSTQENEKLEILVKGLTEDYADTYKNALINLGYVNVVEEVKQILKKGGYYKTKVEDTDYMLVIFYNTRYNLFYVGITNEDTPQKYSDSWAVTGDVAELVNGDSAVYFEMMLEEIFKEKPTITSVTIDLTWNMGGNVGALYRVVGFITDEPFKVSRTNRDTQSASTTYIQIKGVPSYSHLNWSLLTSKVTFSAANSLATIFKENELGPILGVQSGGGACSITPILLPNGTAFTMSSNNINALRVGEGSEENPYKYLDNEYGIKPDYIINIFQLLSEEKILEALNDYYK